MRRRNVFPDPNITQSLAPYAPSIVKVDFPVVDGRNWARATVLTVGDTYVQYSLKGDRLPPAGTYHMHCRTFAQHANAYVRVYTRVGDNYEMPLENEITDSTTVDVDGTVTVPDGCEELIIRIQTGNVVGAIGMMSDILIERADTYATAVGGWGSGLLRQGHGSILTLRRVTADETRESKHGGDQAHRQWVRGADGRIDLYRHGGRPAAFASMGQYYARLADDRHVFRDSHGHVIRRYRDGREGDHRGWRGHHARNEWLVVERHIARQGRARDHTVHRMFQRRGLAGHASLGRRLLRQGYGNLLALGLGVAA